MTKQDLRDELTTLFSGREHFGEVYITEAMMFFDEYEKHRDEERVKELERLRQQSLRINASHSERHKEGNPWYISAALAYKNAIAIMTEEAQPDSSIGEDGTRSLEETLKTVEAIQRKVREQESKEDNG